MKYKVGQKVVIVNGLAWNNVECRIIEIDNDLYTLQRLDTNEKSRNDFDEQEFKATSKLHKAMK